ncbi:hypothetical protein [Leptodesmis sp.]|uniref:hypothetical protein n=1 Tax=Leptodesmis sp. TaxID=3100501 RepID=UPI00405350D7
MTYTADESKTVVQAVMMSGMAVAIADIGIISTAIEMSALARELVGATRNYPNNSIIQSIFSEVALKHNSPGEVPKDITPENASDKAIEAINSAISLLSTKATPEEVNEFKQFVYTSAEAVANAAGSGLFGSGTQKVSDREAATLAKLKAALGI